FRAEDGIRDFHVTGVQRCALPICAMTYSQAIDVLPEGGKGNWVYYYFRDICEERSKQWPRAEADLKKALELQPDQPHVLNYLGRSEERRVGKARRARAAY